MFQTSIKYVSLIIFFIEKLCPEGKRSPQNQLITDKSSHPL